MVGGRCFIVCRRSAAAGLGLSGARPPAARSHHPASRAEAHSRASPEPLPTPWSRSRIQGGRDGNGPRSGLELFSALKGSDFPEGRGGGKGTESAAEGQREPAKGATQWERVCGPGGSGAPGLWGSLVGGAHRGSRGRLPPSATPMGRARPPLGVAEVWWGHPGLDPLFTLPGGRLHSPPPHPIRPRRLSSSAGNRSGGSSYRAPAAPSCHLARAGAAIRARRGRAGGEAAPRTPPRGGSRPPGPVPPAPSPLIMLTYSHGTEY